MCCGARCSTTSGSVRYLSDVLSNMRTKSVTTPVIAEIT
jgi:hypothetical protein